MPRMCVQTCARHWHLSGGLLNKRRKRFGKIESRLQRKALHGHPSKQRPAAATTEAQWDGDVCSDAFEYRWSTIHLWFGGLHGVSALGTAVGQPHWHGMHNNEGSPYAHAPPHPYPAGFPQTPPPPFSQDGYYAGTDASSEFIVDMELDSDFIAACNTSGALHACPALPYALALLLHSHWGASVLLAKEFVKGAAAPPTHRGQMVRVQAPRNQNTGHCCAPGLESMEMQSGVPPAS